MKKLLMLVMLVMLVLLAAGMAAADGDFAYESLPDGTLRITAYTGAQTHVEIPAVIDGRPVTHVGSGCFQDAPQVKSVAVPRGVTHLEDYAFGGASQMNAVALPDGLVEIGSNAFSGTSVTEILVPDSVALIGEGAFAGCYGLAKVGLRADHPRYGFRDGMLIDRETGTLLFCYADVLTGTVTVPEGIVRIGDGAMNGGSMTAVELPSSLRTIGYSAMSNCHMLEELRLPEGLETLGLCALSGCHSLRYLSLPASLTAVEDMALDACTALEEIHVAPGNTTFGVTDGMLINHREKTLVRYAAGRTQTACTVPGGVEIIGNSAFDNADHLRSVTLPEGVEELEAYAFFACSGLEEVTLPAGLRSMGISAFFGCDALRAVYIPDDAQLVQLCKGENLPVQIVSGGAVATPQPADASAFEYDVLPDGTLRITAYTGTDANVTIPASIGGRPVTHVGSNAFLYAQDVRSVTIPGGVTHLEDYAFGGASQMNAVALPDGLVEIGSNAFNGTSVTEILLPDSVALIGEGAFAGCYGLAKVGLRADHPRYGFRDGMLIDRETGTLLFCYADALTGTVTVPEGIVRIGNSAMMNGRMTAVELPSSLRTIGYSAMSFCHSLEELRLPEGVEQVSSGAFSGCNALRYVSLPASLTGMEAMALDACTALVEIHVAPGNTTFGVTDGMLINHREKTLVRYAAGRTQTACTVPEGVEIIGNSAFDNAFNLRSVTLPAGVEALEAYAFYSCSALEEIILPAGLREIGSNVFGNCNALQTVYIPDEPYLVQRCTELNLPWQLAAAPPAETPVPTMNDAGFGYRLRADGSAELACYTGGDACLVVPDVLDGHRVTAVAASAFEGCDQVMVILPEGVTELGDHAFRNAERLVAVTLPQSAGQIGREPFAGCDALVSVIAPEGTPALDALWGSGVGVTLTSSSPVGYVYVIRPDGTAELAGYDGAALGLAVPATLEGSMVSAVGSNAFYGCGASVVVLPQGVRRIGEGAFADSDSLSIVVLPQGVTDLGEQAFAGCSALSAVNLPDSLRQLGEGAFAGCASLTQAELPQGLSVLPGSAFAGCASLKRVDLPDGLESIGSWAFADCTGLETIRIPAGVTAIGHEAFAGCTALTAVACEAGSYAQRYCIENGLPCVVVD